MRRTALSDAFVVLVAFAGEARAFGPTDCSATKTDGVTTAYPGGTVVYTIDVSASGDYVALAAPSVVDNFPDACTSVSYSSAAHAGASGNTASGTGDIQDTLSMPPGSSVTYLATCTISGFATGVLMNSVTVSDPFDINGSNDTASDMDTIDPNPDQLFADGFDDGTDCPWSDVQPSRTCPG